MSNLTKLHFTHEIFRNFTCVITILVKFDIHLHGLPREIRDFKVARLDFLGLIPPNFEH